jgi:hypothetical protein
MWALLCFENQTSGSAPEGATRIMRIFTPGVVHRLLRRGDAGLQLQGHPRVHGRGVALQT